MTACISLSEASYKYGKEKTRINLWCWIGIGNFSVNSWFSIYREKYKEIQMTVCVCVCACMCTCAHLDVFLSSVH